MRILSLISLSLLALGASAEVISPSEAMARVKADAPRRMAARLGSSAQPLRTFEAAGAPTLYLFADSESLMVLTADSETQPLVGYSDSYSAASVPPALEYLLGYYSAQIADLRAGRTITAGDTPSGDYAPIAPICTTRWNQGAPYNALTPTLDGEKTPTGCVATAMAQVLRSYQWPETCNGGRYTYDWIAGNQELSLAYNRVRFDWTDMADSYAETDEAPAVATLMQAVGYAADMNYTPGSSGAQSAQLAIGLVRHFRYDRTLLYDRRSWYTYPEWEAKIYAALAEGHPVFYDGANPDLSGAHAFVVDGYRGDGFFHLNWGWGGLSDGYFRLTALDPATQGIGGSNAGYDVYQGAILGMSPGVKTAMADVPLTFYTTSAFTASPSSATVGADVTFGGGLWNATPLSFNDISPAILLEGDDGSERYAVSSARYGELGPNYGANEWTVTLPADLADGSYTVYPAVYDALNDRYARAHTYANGSGQLDATVSAGIVSFASHPVGHLTISSLSLPDELYIATPFIFNATLTNASSENYYGAVTLQLLQSDKSTPLGAFAIELAPGRSSDVSIPFSIPQNLSAGSYTLMITDDTGLRLTDDVTVSITACPAFGALTCSQIKVLSTDKDDLLFEATFNCAENFYADYVALTATVGPTGSEKLYLTSPQPVVLKGGESAVVTFSGAMPNGIAGHFYYAHAWYINRETGYRYEATGSDKRVRFKLTSSESAIDDIESADSPAEYFDLNGRRVDRPAHGLYIRRQGSQISKIIL